MIFSHQRQYKSSSALTAPHSWILSFNITFDGLFYLRCNLVKESGFFPCRDFRLKVFRETFFLRLQLSLLFHLCTSAATTLDGDLPKNSEPPTRIHIKRRASERPFDKPLGRQAGPQGKGLR